MPEITIDCPDGAFSAYLASPTGNKGGGVLVIQEIFGVNKDMRNHCDHLAAESDAECNLSYYGVGIAERPAAADGITAPTHLHIVEEDGFVPKEEQAKIKASACTALPGSITPSPAMPASTTPPPRQHSPTAARWNASTQISANHHTNDRQGKTPCRR